MSEIIITTDGTIQGTVLSVDGKNKTKAEKIVSISLWASAPYKSKFSGDNVPGQVSCTYEAADEKGTIERKTVSSGDTSYNCGIGCKMDNDDSVIRHLGQEADKAIVDLVDKIVAECEKTKAKCPSRDILLSRDLVSLKDKATDLGIKLEEVVLPVVVQVVPPVEGGNK